MEKKTLHFFRLSKEDIKQFLETALRLSGNPDTEAPGETSFIVFGNLNGENGGINYYRKWLSKSSFEEDITKQITVGVSRENLEKILIQATTELKLPKALNAIFQKKDSSWNKDNWDKGEPTAIVFSFEIEEVESVT